MQTQTKAMFQKFGNKSLELSGRLGAQKHLAVLRDAFALFTPLIIVGALAVLIRSFVFGGGGDGVTQSSILGWISKAAGSVLVDAKGQWSLVPDSAAATASHIGNFLFYAISHSTIDLMSIYVAFGIGYFLSKVRGSDAPLIAGVLSLAAFLVSIAGIPGLMGATGLLTAIVVSIVATELFCLLAKSGRLEIKMPAGVPPAVARAFGKLLPSMIILTIVVAINLPFVLVGVLKGIVPENNFWGDTGTWTLGNAIYVGIQAPFMSFAGSNSGGLGMAFVYVTAVAVFWFFGIHGTNVIMGIFSPIFLALYGDNVTANGDWAHSSIFVQGTFDAFIFLGGTGSTLAFITAIFILSRNSQERALAKLAAGPGIFQINEPIIFGMPLILNVKYVVPFIITMPVLTLTTYLGFTWFDIHPVTVLIPWTMPTGIGGLLATAMDWKGFVLAMINFAIAFACWAPWVALWSIKELKNERRAKKERAARKAEKAALADK